MSDGNLFCTYVELVLKRRRWHYREMAGNSKILTHSQRFSDYTEAYTSASKMAGQLGVPLINGQTGDRLL